MTAASSQEIRTQRHTGRVQRRKTDGRTSACETLYTPIKHI